MENEINSKETINYPKRGFEVNLEKTHHKEESDYFFYTDPSFYN